MKIFGLKSTALNTSFLRGLEMFNLIVSIFCFDILLKTEYILYQTPTNRPPTLYCIQ